MWALVKAVPLKWWGIAAVILALAGTAAWQYSARQAAEVRAAQAERDLAEFRRAYDVLALTTAEQTRAVQALHDEGERRRREAAQALKQAQADSDTWRRSADRLRAILAAPVPMSCDEAVERAKGAL